MYWTDSKAGTISVLALDGKESKTIVNTNLDHPYALVVDPAGK